VAALSTSSAAHRRTGEAADGAKSARPSRGGLGRPSTWGPVVPRELGVALLAERGVDEGAEEEHHEVDQAPEPVDPRRQGPHRLAAPDAASRRHVHHGICPENTLIRHDRTPNGNSLTLVPDKCSGKHELASTSCSSR